jgi:uncharacterized oxidoreductase
MVAQLFSPASASERSSLLIDAKLTDLPTARSASTINARRCTRGCGNQVIVAGRRPGALDETTTANPGMRLVLDIEDRDAIPAFAARIAAAFPTLMSLSTTPGSCGARLLPQALDLTTAEATVATNLLGPIRLTAAFLPHLRRQPGATVLMVSSGLAFFRLR